MLFSDGWPWLRRRASPVISSPAPRACPDRRVHRVTRRRGESWRGMWVTASVTVVGDVIERDSSSGHDPADCRRRQMDTAPPAGAGVSVMTLVIRADPLFRGVGRLTAAVSTLRVHRSRRSVWYCDSMIVGFCDAESPFCRATLVVRTPRTDRAHRAPATGRHHVYVSMPLRATRRRRVPHGARSCRATRRESYLAAPMGARSLCFASDPFDPRRNFGTVTFRNP